MGKILREHDDLDYLTLNLHSLKSKFAEVFSGIGWQAKDLENSDLRLKKENVRVHLGNVEFGSVATWTHNGERGSLCFPVSWLDLRVIEFYGIELHVVAVELQFVLKEHPELLNPDWRSRNKDILEKECLRDILLKRGIEVDSLHELVASISSSL
jgi:hypothetical protein